MNKTIYHYHGDNILKNYWANDEEREKAKEFDNYIADLYMELN